MSDETATAQDLEAEDAEGEAGAKPKKKLNKFVLIGGAVALVLVLGGGAALFFLFSGSPEDAEKIAVAKPSVFYNLPEMTVNLSNEDSESDKEQFLKLNIALEVADQSVIDLIEPNMPRVLDAFQVYLRELRKSDLEGSAGLYLLKEELRRRVNIAVQPAEVDSILFKEILVQ
jgi:flagellar protein FliL